jgi:hypothetical protein
VDPINADAIRAAAINPGNKRFMSHLPPLDDVASAIAFLSFFLAA